MARPKTPSKFAVGDHLQRALSGEHDAEVQRATSEILIYSTEDGRSRVECRLDGATIWLTQALMAELFQTTPQNITLHLRALFADGELDEVATCKGYLQVGQEGVREVRRSVKHYNLNAIMAVGFRVRSPRGAQFRRWAAERLHEYLVKGFTMDDERLRNPPAASLGVPDYFDELLERIRDIRASERRMYLRVQEIFKLAADYAATAPDTAEFFKIMQNKLHFAATGKTAAELVAERADHKVPNMGLTSWKGDTVRKADVIIGKNYLQHDEIEELNRIVVMWLDFAEDQAKHRKHIFLRDWETRLDDFLRFNDRRVLRNAGSVSKKDADTRAEAEYAAFAEQRRKWLEAQGAEDGLRALEEAVKQLPAVRAATGSRAARKPKEPRKP